MRALKVIKLEPGDDFNIIQQEILMMIQCSHSNIISYFGSYLKYLKFLELISKILMYLLDEINYGLQWNYVQEDQCRISIMVSLNFIFFLDSI